MRGPHLYWFTCGLLRFAGVLVGMGGCSMLVRLCFCFGNRLISCCWGFGERINALVSMMGSVWVVVLL